MVWCRKATSLLLNQCWPGFVWPCACTRPQWIEGYIAFTWLSHRTGENLYDVSGKRRSYCVEYIFDVNKCIMGIRKLWILNRYKMKRSLGKIHLISILQLYHTSWVMIQMLRDNLSAYHAMINRGHIGQVYPLCENESKSLRFEIPGRKHRLYSYVIMLYLHYMLVYFRQSDDRNPDRTCTGWNIEEWSK